MLKGDKIRLIPVTATYTPGEGGLDAEVTDTKDGVMTCSVITPTNGLSTMSYVVEGTGEAVYAKRYIAGKPTIIQFRKDEIMEAFFKGESLMPKFDRKTLRYIYSLPIKTLEMWVQNQILDKEQVDWHYACRECDTMVTVRDGCYNCYAASDRNAKLMRHNECGYIGYPKSFDAWTCPGCSGMLNTENATFDNVLGPAKCEACGYKAVPTQVASCLGCGKVFPLCEAVEMPIFMYRKKAHILRQTSGATF